VKPGKRADNLLINRRMNYQSW